MSCVLPFRAFIMSLIASSLRRRHARSPIWVHVLGSMRREVLVVVERARGPEVRRGGALFEDHRRSRHTTLAVQEVWSWPGRCRPSRLGTSKQGSGEAAGVPVVPTLVQIRGPNSGQLVGGRSSPQFPDPPLEASQWTRRTHCMTGAEAGRREGIGRRPARARVELGAAPRGRDAAAEVLGFHILRQRELRAVPPRAGQGECRGPEGASSIGAHPRDPRKRSQPCTASRARAMGPPHTLTLPADWPLPPLRSHGGSRLALAPLRRDHGGWRAHFEAFWGSDYPLLLCTGARRCGE